VSVSLILTASAQKDLDDAFQWYEEQDPGLGKEFIRCVDAKIANLNRNPLYYQIVKNERVRRALVSRFPFSIYFVSEEEVITIFAILDQRRSPEFWKSRMKHRILRKTLRTLNTFLPYILYVYVYYSLAINYSEPTSHRIGRL